MKTLQYYHQIHHNLEKREKDLIRKLQGLASGEFTAFCHVPELKDVYELMATKMNCETAHIAIAVGITKVHPNDQYCKAIGRQKSLERARSRLFNLENVQFLPGNKVLLTLVPTLGEEINSLYLEIGPNRRKPYFVGIDIE